jgi:pimeloyl-ACP methyl ester carboxylesterase
VVVVGRQRLVLMNQGTQTMPCWSRTLAAAFAVATITAITATPIQAGSDIGVVVLHGKQGMGGGDRVTAPFINALHNAGYATQAPTMCWSRQRMYDATWPDCLREIDTAVAALRAAGARRIVVAGQSQGGNAAIDYGVQHPELAGVIALAPAGQPEQLVRGPAISQSITKAQQMVAAGQGGQRTDFMDTNNGQTFSVTTTPAIYLSIFLPGGPADFPKALPRLRQPIIWVSGTHDPTQRNAALLFPQLPANRLNRFVQVNSPHLQTPAAGAEATMEWLATLPAQ